MILEDSKQGWMDPCIHGSTLSCFPELFLASDEEGGASGGPMCWDAESSPFPGPAVVGNSCTSLVPAACPTLELAVALSSPHPKLSYICFCLDLELNNRALSP